MESIYYRQHCHRTIIPINHRSVRSYPYSAVTFWLQGTTVRPFYLHMPLNILLCYLEWKLRSTNAPIKMWDSNFNISNTFYCAAKFPWVRVAYIVQCMFVPLSIGYDDIMNSLGLLDGLGLLYLFRMVRLSTKHAPVWSISYLTKWPRKEPFWADSSRWSWPVELEHLQISPLWLISWTS